MIRSFYHWILLVVVGFAYVLAGIPLLLIGRAGHYYRWVSISFGRSMLWAAGAKAFWSGLENLDSEKTYIFVGNHQSYVDIFLIQAALGAKGMRTLFMLKKDLFKIPLFGTVARQMGLVPVERQESRQALKAMLNAMDTLKKGYSLVIFPEGTRTYDGTLHPFKRGAFMLAERSGKEILPFVITGTLNIMPRKGMRITPGPCRISFLPAVNPENYEGKTLMLAMEGLLNKQYAEEKAIMDEKWLR